MYLLPDFPKLYDVTVSIKVDKTITSVISEPDGQPIEFKQSGDTVTFNVPPFKLHQLIVLKY